MILKHPLDLQVGLIIGKKGAWIKNLCQETNARVKVMEAIPRTEERGVSWLGQ